MPDDPYPAWAPQPVPDDLRPAWTPPPGPRRPTRGFFTAYFAAGLALLMAGLVFVVVLLLRPRDAHLADPAVLPSLSGPAVSGPAAAVGSAVSPSLGPNGATLGPQRLAMGKTLPVTGENGEKFQVTVVAGKYHRTACDEYSVQPKNGGYLPTTIRVKVLEGVPDVSEFAFRFQKPDGEWLDSVGGTGCVTTGSTGLFRRLTAGRTYTTMVVFDVPKQPLTGDIVFVWPLEDVIGSWKVA